MTGISIRPRWMTNGVMPQWPNARTLDRYCELTGLDIRQELSSGGVWIDIGSGPHAKALSGVIRSAATKLVAIDCGSVVAHPGIDVVNAIVPEDTTPLHIYGGSARLVTDVYAALSFGDDPVQALIYGACFLEAHGTFVAITEEQRFGSEETLRRIVSFFQNSMGQRVEFEKVRIFADANRRWEVAMRVTVRGTSPHYDDLELMYYHACDTIGIPHNGAVLWESSDKLAQIRQVDYLR